MNAYLDPAWDVTFELRISDRAQQVTGWKFTGECQNDRFVLRPAQSAHPMAIGELCVRSWQPYRADALDDATRAAWDVAVVLGALQGGVTLDPVLPPLLVEGLSGAKKSGSISVGVSASVSLSVTSSLESRAWQLHASAALRENPDLRADLDTLHLAKQDPDAASALIHYYRIYERRAAAVMANAPAAIPDPSAEVAAHAVSGELNLEDSVLAERARSAVVAALKRLKAAPRTELLSEAWTHLLGRPVSKSEVSAADAARGRVAHNPNVREATPPEHALVVDVVIALLRRDLEKCGKKDE